LTFELKFDFGQIILGSLIAIIGYLIKRQINEFSDRLDKHDEMIRGLFGDVQYIVGVIGHKKRERHEYDANDHS
jgi:hypothetical protein